MTHDKQPLDILNYYKEIVWPEIATYLIDPDYPSQFKIPKKYQPFSEKYWSIVKEYPQRKGKYLRPTLILLVAQAMGCNIQKAIKTAAAMQISEDWLLIHDDFQDNSKMRRGQQTLHKMYGSELAVNAGDTLHIIMWKVLLDNLTLLGDQKTFDIANEFYKILKRTSDGQAIEIMWSKNSQIDFTDADWFFIADGKTSYYTITGPLRLGGMISEAQPDQINKLTLFGKYLGRCFQLVDDLLDITSTYKGPGDLIGNDIYESKKTIMLCHLIRSASNNDKKRIINIISKSAEEKNPDEIVWIINQMKKYGSIAYGKKLASKLKNKALKIFDNELNFLDCEPHRKDLRQLVNFVIERDH